MFKQYRGIAWLIALAGFFVIIALRFNDVTTMIQTVWHAFIPLVTGIFLAFILDILVKKYEGLCFARVKVGWADKMRRPVSILLSLLTIVLVIFFIGRMAVPQLVHSLGIIVNAVPDLYNTASQWVTSHVSGLPYLDNQTVAETISTEDIIAQVRNMGTKGGKYIVDAMSAAVGWIMNFVIGLIFAIYILLDKENLKKQCGRFFRAYLPDKWVLSMEHVSKVVSETFSSFIVGQFLDALILGTMVGVGLAVFNVSYAVTIGCVIGLTALVPLLGAYIGGLMGLIMVLTVSPMEALMYVIILVVMQQVEGNLIYPRVVGSSVGLPGIWVFAAVTLGATLFGIFGMLLGVPLAATVYKLVEEDVDKRLTEEIDSSLF